MPCRRAASTMANRASRPSASSCTQDVYDRFSTCIRRRRAGLARRRSDGGKKAPTSVPSATPQVLDDLLAQVASAVKAGGRVLTGGDRLVGDSGNCLCLSVIVYAFHATPQCAAKRSLGLWRCCFARDLLDEAIECANDTPFGLGASGMDCADKALDQKRFMSAS